MLSKKLILVAFILCTLMRPVYGQGICLQTANSKSNLPEQVTPGSYPDHGFYETLRIICPKWVPPTANIPIIVKALNNAQVLDRYFSDELDISSTALLNPDVIIINHGAGGIVAACDHEDDFSVSINGFTKNINVIQDWPVLNHSGEFSGSENWNNLAIHHITSDIYINATDTLSISEGCRVIVNPDVNIWVYGVLLIEGSSEAPVVISAADPVEAWGGIRIINQENGSEFSNVIFTDGGDNQEYIFGHSSSQPVVFVYFSQLALNNCYFIQNTGKALGGVNSTIFITDCMINKCDTGGEFQSCYVIVEDSHISEIPDADGVVNDDDNDGLYFYNYLPSMGDEPSLINNCIFTIGEDDGIDHNEAKLRIENCLITNFYHEGIAASAGNFAAIYNCVITDCEQGIEAGYGNPQVTINHCVILNNDIGIRFGDSYLEGCTGHITVKNSICFDNLDNILNFDLLIQDSVANAIFAAYTMTNDSHYNQYPFCINAVPEFSAGYYLTPGSPGVSMADDGCDMGLYQCGTGVDEAIVTGFDFIAYPNPCKDKLFISPGNNPIEKAVITISTLEGKILINKCTVLRNGVFTIDLASIKPRKQFVLVSVNTHDTSNVWIKVFLN